MFPSNNFIPEQRPRTFIKIPKNPALYKVKFTMSGIKHKLGNTYKESGKHNP